MSHIATDKKEYCTGCGVCGAVCPVKAIEYSYDEEGFLAPQIDQNKCVNCGKCVEHCHLQSAKKPETKKAIAQYAVKVQDEKVRMNSRSGGVFVALSNAVLEDGGVVYGAVLEGASNVIHLRAESQAERNKMCGSKYVQSDTTKLWEQLFADVKSGRMVLFSGTPCQVAAVYYALGREYDNLYLCDFVCHGVPGPLFWKDYIAFMEAKYKGTVTAFEFRDKRNHSWESHVEELVFDNRVVYSKRYTNLFYTNECLRKSCYTCPYATMDRLSDFTIGDYWGIDEAAPEFNDHKGVSLVLIRNEKARCLFDEVKETLEILDTAATPPIHSGLRKPTAFPPSRQSFWEDYRKKGFGYVSRKYGGYDILRTIKRKLVDKID